ncbi:uncharacterized protein SPPG_02709 [Spizellomyces punctatus DAOM BR117]|uniref:Swi5-domain-containing protein n=1 Tax=Spizellomyces punctatus (strain DAOM BR117) TaxID=645134 RepID=A0A0L0HMA5_SPIPD|nr:uncharacterized protein SPPG_02709 [Spizellomyces punctatus DAOM BR117]KND02227.1 hypothetical protein SPPG_02709 [Spizellomyces punctatus DAOM BR117]|eukprot:XP_016610266.1 hypothetical protein SPPG_02709 [Spizellomyces punctatus DAOM BR117]
MLASSSDLPKLIVARLRTAEGPVSLNELKKAFASADEPEDAVANAINKLLSDGEIKHRNITGATESSPDVDIYWIPITCEHASIQPPSHSTPRKSQPTATPRTPEVDIVQQAAYKETLKTDVANLRQRIAELTEEGRSLESALRPGVDVEEMLNSHIKLLHEYNEIKDVGQMLIGKCAEQNGTTTRSMYGEFGLDPDD